MVKEDVINDLKLNAEDQIIVNSKLEYTKGCTDIEYITEACAVKIFNKTRNLYLHGSTPQNLDAKWVRDEIVKCICERKTDIELLKKYLNEPLTPEQAYCTVKILSSGVKEFDTPSHEVSEMVTLGLINMESYIDYTRGREATNNGRNIIRPAVKRD